LQVPGAPKGAKSDSTVPGDSFVSETEQGEAPAQAPGKVIHDPRGNAIWDWALETTEFAKATMTGLIRRLECPPLTLELDTMQPGGWSGDPYNRW
jgi:hypothetical protein